MTQAALVAASEVLEELHLPHLECTVLVGRREAAVADWVVPCHHGGRGAGG